MDLLTFISLLVFLGIICASEGAPIPNIGKVAEEIKTSLGSGAEMGFQKDGELSGASSFVEASVSEKSSGAVALEIFVICMCYMALVVIIAIVMRIYYRFKKDVQAKDSQDRLTSYTLTYYVPSKEKYITQKYTDTQKYIWV